MAQVIFTLTLDVTDTIALWHAAALRAVQEGAFDDEDAYREEYGEDDIAQHVRMLLDPGSLDGCDIIDSDAGEVEHGL